MNERLRVLREAGRRVCGRLVEGRRDVVAVFIVGSAARGGVHEASDVDLCVLVGEEGRPVRESIQELGCRVDVAYVPLRLWMERLRRGVGSMWEIGVSSILDSIVLYDPTGIVERVRRELAAYPEGKRVENVLHHLHLMGWYENAVEHHYARGNYDVESIFSKLFAVEALRILFPLNGVYLKGDKYLFEQVESLEAPPGYLEKCFSLLWFRSRGVERGEAKWILDTVLEARRVVEREVRRRGIELPGATPP